MWNTGLDVGAELDSWLQRAYGEGWSQIRSLYDALDARMLAHKQAQPPAYKGSQYEVNEDVLKNIHAPLFPDMEAKYLGALSACRSDLQRKRLTMFGDNLTQLHFALRKAGLIPDNPRSVFLLDDDAFAAFMTRMESTFSLHRDNRGLDHGPVWKGEWNAP
jgi:hypothetical protein